MSAVSPSDPSDLPSLQSPQARTGALSRLSVRLTVDKSHLADITAEIIRLADRLMPDTPHLIVTDGDTVTLRVRHEEIRVCQTDTLVVRLARLRGIRCVRAEQKSMHQGVVYQATLRGRAWRP